MEVPTRRRPTLSHQLSMIDSSNLGDLLKVREDEDEIHHRSRRETVTLATVLACEKRDFSSPSATTTTSPTTGSGSGSKTLLDIIRDEDDPRSLVIRSEEGGNHQRISWKSFRDRLRFRRANDAWTSSSGSTSTITITHNSGDDYAADIPSPPVGSSRRLSAAGSATVVGTRSSPGTTVVESQAIAPPGGPARHHPATEEPIRVSLMALLEQADVVGYGSDNLHGTSTIAAAMISVVDEADEVDAGRHESGDGRTYVCCVCMVRHKGAAFIPCGHTFCRLCSRELWLSRGNCPLCNGFILEILDIF